MLPGFLCVNYSINPYFRLRHLETSAGHSSIIIKIFYIHLTFIVIQDFLNVFLEFTGLPLISVIMFLSPIPIEANKPLSVTFTTPTPLSSPKYTLSRSVKGWKSAPSFSATGKSALLRNLVFPSWSFKVTDVVFSLPFLW